MRSKACRTLVSAMITLQLMNMSIDAVDPMPNCEDLSVNEIESCVELIVEVILGHDNAIQETDDDDGSGTKPSARIVLFSALTTGIILELENEAVSNQSESPYLVSFKSVTRSITSPPPRVV
jgi:hypothetical protein